MTALRVKPAYGGWNTDASPDYVPELQAPLVENLLGRAGKLVMRGPIHHPDVALSFVAGAYPEGCMIKGTNALITTTNAGTPTATRVTLDTNAITTPTAVVVTNDTTPARGRSVELATFANAISMSGTFLRWTGSAAAPTSYNDAAAPNFCTDIEIFAERVFTASGSLAGNYFRNGLRYSVPGGPVAGTLADWTDPISGLANLIRVGDADEILAIRAVGRELLIFKQRSVWKLSGSGSGSFTVTRVSAEGGCLHRDTVAVLGDAAYWLSDMGYMRYDGAAVSSVSRAIAPAMSRVIGAVLTAPAGHSPYFSAARIREGCLMFTLALSGATPSTVFQGIYDTQRDTWTKFSTGASGRATQVVLLQPGPYGHTIASNGTRAFYVSDVGVAGVYKNDVPVSLLDVIGSNTEPINAKFHSRLIKLGTPLSTSLLKRIMLDYRVDIGADVPGWFVSLVRGDGTVALAEYQVPGEAAGAPTYLARRRSTTDVHTEVTDVQLRVEWRTTTTPMTIAEIYDANIEFQSARDRSAT